MPAALDHVVVATDDLAAATERYERLGFRVAFGGEHPGNGTSNAIMRFGLDYLELLAPDPSIAARRARGRELVAFVQAHRGGLINYCLRGADAIEAARDALPGTPAPQPLSRRLPTGGEMRWRMLLPGGSNCRRPWPFFIDWETPDDDRLALEPAGDHPNGALGMAGVVIGGWLPDSLTGLYETIGLAPEKGEPVDGESLDTRRIGLDGASVELASPTSLDTALARALAAHGEGPYAVVVTVASLEVVRSHLVQHAVAHAEHPARIVVDPAWADGARIAFVPDGAASNGSWAAMFEAEPTSSGVH